MHTGDDDAEAPEGHEGRTPVDAAGEVPHPARPGCVRVRRDDGGVDAGPGAAQYYHVSHHSQYIILYRPET